MQDKDDAMMKKLIRDSRLAALMVFLVSMAVSALIISRQAVLQKQRNIELAGYVASGEANKIKYAIDSRVLTTEILEMIIVDGNGTIHDFDKVAATIYENDTSIRSIQLAPDGVVSYLYPLKGNERGFGDLFANPERRVEAEYARDTGKMTLAGPVDLYQGGVGLVARNPIYITDQEGVQNFWGFSIVILNVPQIFDKANLTDLTGQSYAYRIWRTNPDTGAVQIILEQDGGKLTEPVETSVEVPNGTWTLSIAPKDGWIGQGYVAFRAALAVIISVLAALVFYGIITMDRQKQALSVLANTDPLTGLYNERYMTSTLKALSGEGMPFGLFYLDLNQFKQVNDRYGHDVGDRLLMEVALRIKGCTGGEDFVFRIGGDEFSVITTGDCSEECCRNLKERIQKTVEVSFHADGNVLHPHISCGYSRCPEDGTDREELIRQADQRMYREKRSAAGQKDGKTVDTMYEMC